MKTSLSLMIKVAVLFVLFSSTLMAQKSGQSIQIQYGVVVASKYVEEQSNARKGAVVGGLLVFTQAKASLPEPSSEERLAVQ